MVLFSKEMDYATIMYLRIGIHGFQFLFGGVANLQIVAHFKIVKVKPKKPG